METKSYKRKEDRTLHDMPVSKLSALGKTSEKVTFITAEFEFDSFKI